MKEFFGLMIKLNGIFAGSFGEVPERPKGAVC